MGLDVYAGTLIRYYMNNWKTVIQQFAEDNGLKYETIRVQDENGEDDEELSLEETKEIVLEWKKAIEKGLEINSKSIWNEDYDTTPYYTDKPDWDALNALLLYIASKYTHKDLPKTMEKNIDIYKDPIVLEFLQTKDFSLSLFDGNGWWLPIDRDIMFDYYLPNSEKSVLATSRLLYDELNVYNNFEWKADRDTIISWSKTEGYPIDKIYSKEKGLEKVYEKQIYYTESLAKFAFSILWQAAEFSLEHGVVIIFDY